MTYAWFTFVLICMSCISTTHMRLFNIQLISQSNIATWWHWSSIKIIIPDDALQFAFLSCSPPIGSISRYNINGRKIIRATPISRKGQRKVECTPLPFKDSTPNRNNKKENRASVFHMHASIREDVAVWCYMVLPDAVVLATAAMLCQKMDVSIKELSQ